MAVYQINILKTMFTCSRAHARDICIKILHIIKGSKKKMNIQQIKDKYTCLDYLGKPVKKVANGYLYRCPYRNDDNPSLSVTLNGKGWHDLRTDEHGNLIDLVMKCLRTTSLADVCAAFSADCAKSFSFPSPKDTDGRKEKVKSFVKWEIVPLQSRGLYGYLYKRGVDIRIAKQFLQECRYSFKPHPSYLYALAYQNDKGGYELRNPTCKLSNTPKWITTHLNRENAPLVVFEGFLDMLSFATLCGEVRHNYIVLNSIVNVDIAIETIRNGRNLYGRILLALDNDDGGTEATEKLLEAFPDATDIRHRYAPYNDINDYLIKKISH